MPPGHPGAPNGLGGGGRVPINSGVNSMPVGGDPKSGQDRGRPGGPPPGPPPSRAELLLEEVLKELRVANQQRTQERMQPPKSDFLSKIPPTSVVPFFKLMFALYANSAGTNAPVGTTTMPQGTALVITQLRPVYFTASAGQIVEFSNEYAMLGFDKFDIAIDGAAIGDFSTQYASGGTLYSNPNLVIQHRLTEQLGFNSVLYAAIVRGGRKLQVRHTVLAVVDPGGSIPSYVGMEIGGFKVPEIILNKVLGGEG